MRNNKWEAWYDAQPDHIKRWYDQPRAIWYDSDMFKAFVFGLGFGILIGLCI